MKIVLVTRGSHGDVYPYFHIGKELQKRGHDVTLSIPKLFENDVRQYQLNYVLQDFDDITGMMSKADEKSFSVKVLLDWVKESIGKQFEQLIPIVEKADLFVSTNTEFAASSIAEYCKKTFIRTAYAPLLPGKSIAPPLFPFPKANRLIIPLLWKMLNFPTDIMMSKTINRHRRSLGLKSITSITQHSVANAHNVLMYSPFLGTTDPNWKWKWDINGYCFNDNFTYDQQTYNDLIRFLDKDEKPNLFFTLGSCTSKKSDYFISYLSQICKEENFKLIIGAGWSKTDSTLEESDNVFMLKKAIPHNLIFSKCAGIIHHGGSGTTHNVARHGIPQMMVPLFIDQHYWGHQVNKLGLGPEYIKIGKVSKEELKSKVKDLVYNTNYKENAFKIGDKMQQEDATNKFCNFVANHITC